MCIGGVGCIWVRVCVHICVWEWVGMCVCIYTSVFGLTAEAEILGGCLNNCERLVSFDLQEVGLTDSALQVGYVCIYELYICMCI